MFCFVLFFLRSYLAQQLHFSYLLVIIVAIIVIILITSIKWVPCKNLDFKLPPKTVLSFVGRKWKQTTGLKVKSLVAGTFRSYARERCAKIHEIHERILVLMQPQRPISPQWIPLKQTFWSKLINLYWIRNRCTILPAFQKKL